MKPFFYSLLCIACLFACTRNDLPLKGSKEALIPRISLANKNAWIDGAPFYIGKALASSGELRTGEESYLAVGFDGKNTIYFGAQSSSKFLNEPKEFILSDLEGFIAIIRPNDSGTNQDRNLILNIDSHKFEVKSGALFIHKNGTEFYLYLFKGEGKIDGENFLANTAFIVSQGKIKPAEVNLFSASRFLEGVFNDARIKESMF